MADLTAIRPRMEVMSSDGELVGHVHSSDQGRLLVSPLRAPPGAAGRDVDTDWVSRVDEHVHLRHGAAVIRGRWSGSAESRPRRTEGGAKIPWLIGLVLLAIAVLLLIWGFVYAADDGTTAEPLPSTGEELEGG